MYFDYSYAYINLVYSYDHNFCNYCQYGHLDLAQRLYSSSYVDINFDNDKAFRKSCENGHLEMLNGYIIFLMI